MQFNKKYLPSSSGSVTKYEGTLVVGKCCCWLDEIELERLILLRVFIKIFPFLFEDAPDLTDEDADDAVDEEERISMGTAWCKDTRLELVPPPCTLLLFP